MFVRLSHAEARGFHIFVRIGEIEAIIPLGDGSRISTMSRNFYDVHETPSEVHQKILIVMEERYNANS